MNRIRRALAVTALAIAAVIGVAVPAGATFADTARVASTVDTLTVAAPSSVTVTHRCWGFRYWATVSWPASTTSRGVVGYRVMATRNTGESVVMAQTDARTLSFKTGFPQGHLGYQPRLSVITLTSYGWTAESPRTAYLRC